MALPERIRQIREFLKGAPQKPQRTPLPFIRRPVPKKPASPQKPKTLFEEKKAWHRVELRRRMTKASPYIPGTGGKTYTKRERMKMVEEVFPYQRFQSYISETKAKRRLRELRKEEYQAKTGAEKLKLGRLRRYLEEQTGLKGKY